MNKDNIGFEGENIACNYLEMQGCEILDRNFICNSGEIDIIAKDKDELVFIEVKTRRNSKYGNPIDAVDLNKINHILKTAKFYVYINNLEKEFIRFDIIEVYMKNNETKINQIKNIMM